MAKVIELGKIKNNIMIDDDGESFLKKLYKEKIAIKEHNGYKEYEDMLNYIKGKKQTRYTLRDTIILTLLLKYRVEYVMVGGLKWEDIDIEKRIIRLNDKLKINIEIDKELLRTIKTYSDMNRGSSDFFLSNNKGKQLSTKALTNLHKKYVGIIKEEANECIKTTKRATKTRKTKEN